MSLNSGGLEFLWLANLRSSEIWKWGEPEKHQNLEVGRIWMTSEPDRTGEQIWTPDKSMYTYIHIYIYTHADWCCFDYFARNSLVVLLTHLWARIYFFRFVDTGFSRHFVSPVFFVCKVFVSKSLDSTHLNQSPVPGCSHSSCVLFIDMYLCVCTSVRACVTNCVYVYKYIIKH